MKLRQIIIVASAVAIVLLGRFAMGKMSQKEAKKAAPIVDRTITVFADTVVLNELPVFIETTGVLEALQGTDIFSEVQGIMLPDRGRFKAGNRFDKGQILLALRADEQRAQLVSQRSTFESLMSSLLPDLRIDFTTEYPKWQSFLENLNVNNDLPPLPSVEDKKLKAFLTGRNLYSQFYAVRNAEIIFQKYFIRAPFSGQLTQANVQAGTVIRQGQNLGRFIQTGLYELQASVDAGTASRLELGQEVELKMEGPSTKSWKGKISRINTAVDQQSQLSRFFVDVRSSELKDGLFMQAFIRARSVDRAFEIPRSALVSGNKVFVVRDSLIDEKEITTEHLTQNSAIVLGLENGDVVLNKIPPGAFPGMKVKVYKGE